MPACRRRCALLLVLIAGVFLGRAAPVLADSSTQTGTAGLGFMAVDSTNHHVFLTGPNGPNVQVFDFSGNSVATITDPGAAGIAIDSGTLYVASCGGTTIDEFSTSTFAKIGSISTSQAMAYPCDLVVAGGRLWFDMPTDFGIAEPSSVTLAAPHTEFQWYWPNQPNYTIDPADTNTLLMSSQYGEPAYQDVWDIGADPPTMTTQQFNIVDPGAGDTAAVSTDGVYAYVADPNGHVTRFAMPDLVTVTGTLVTSRGIAISVAVSPDGTHVAVGNSDEADGVGGGLDIYLVGHSTPIRSIVWPGTGEPRDLAYSADGTRLFAFADAGSGSSSQTLEVVTQANLPGSHVTLAPSASTVPPGGQVQLAGSLAMQDGASCSGKTISISVRRPDATTAVLGTATTAADCTYQLGGPALIQLGDYTFTAPFAGNATRAGDSASAVVHVAKIVSTLALGGAPSTIAPGQQSSLQGSLTFADASNSSGMTVAITGQAPDSSPLDLGSVVTDSSGRFTVPTGQLDQLGAYHFTARYAGDATHGAVETAATVNVAVIKTTLTLKAGASTIVYGKSVTLKAHLAGGSPGLQVTISYQTSHGLKQIVGELDGSLNYAAKVAPKRNTAYTASYAGDEAHEAATDAKVVVKVAPVITGMFSGAYAQSGSYHLFHYHSSCASSGSLCPLFTEKMIPNHAGHTVYAVLQAHTRRGWQSVLAWHKRLGRTSTAVFKLRYGNTGVIGHKYRLAAVFKGDSDHSAVGWGYWYFEISH